MLPPNDRPELISDQVFPKLSETELPNVHPQTSKFPWVLGFEKDI